MRARGLGPSRAAAGARPGRRGGAPAAPRPFARSAGALAACAITACALLGGALAGCNGASSGQGAAAGQSAAGQGTAGQGTAGQATSAAAPSTTGSAPGGTAAPTAPPASAGTGAGAPFQAPREERTPAYDASFSVSTKGGELELEYTIKAHEEMYVSDRLWDGDVVHSRAPDPHGVYRFVKDGSLRLVFAQAPRPPGVHLGNTYAPLYSRIRAGETRRRAVRIKLPVDEYSALARDVGSPTVLEDVSRVYLVIGYRLRKDMDRDPAPPAGESGDEAGYVVYAPKYIYLSLDDGKIPVKRRTGDIARFLLPGER